MRTNEKQVKDYFKSEDTVSKWWEPEGESTDGYYTRKDVDVYIQEKRDIIKLIEPKDKIILDCATGKGRVVIGLAKEGAKELIGVDISKEMLAIAKERAKNEGVQDKIIFEEGDAENLKYPDDHFDAVVSIQTFMHLPNPQKGMFELARVIKPGGIIIVDHQNKNPIWRINVRGWRNFFFRGVIRDFYFSTIAFPFRYPLYKFFNYPLNPIEWNIKKREFLELFKQAKLDVIEVLDYGPNYCPMYFLVKARKSTENRSKSKEVCYE